jgi:nitrate reductase cytochrome c-type subunit
VGEQPSKDASSQTPPEQSTAAPAPSSQPPREPIKVNKYNLTELKNACDDCLRKVFATKILFQVMFLKF